MPKPNDVKEEDKPSLSDPSRNGQPSSTDMGTQSFTADRSTPNQSSSAGSLPSILKGARRSLESLVSDVPQINTTGLSSVHQQVAHKFTEGASKAMSSASRNVQDKVNKLMDGKASEQEDYIEEQRKNGNFGPE